MGPVITVTRRGREMLAALLRHEAKTTSDKYALVRALNDLALEYPLETGDEDVLVPLQRVAERWLVSYWPFVGPVPVAQGQRAQRDGTLRQDLSFRPALTRLRAAWEAQPGTRVDPADGALLLADLRAGRLPPVMAELTGATLAEVALAVRQPVRYAGPAGEHGLFGAPQALGRVPGVPLPGSRAGEGAFVVPGWLWSSLRALSLWVEALGLHEWSRFTERVTAGGAGGSPVSRGEAFMLLTAAPERQVLLDAECAAVTALMRGGTGPSGITVRYH